MYLTLWLDVLLCGTPCYSFHYACFVVDHFFLQPSKNARGDTYSALAVFSSMEEAHRVYESLEGTLEKVHFSSLNL